MIHVVIGLPVQRARAAAVGSPGFGLAWLAVLALIPAAWALLLLGQATGLGILVHQHGSAEVTLPPLVALVSFLVSWQLMVAATMLPASLPSCRAAIAASRRLIRPVSGTVAFLGGFVCVWTLFGLLVFVVGQAVARLDAAAPWLAARPWLLQAFVVALAGSYQLTWFKRCSLAACRRPDRLLADGPSSRATFYGVGLRHGLACLGSAWALMAVMVVGGLADLWWMAALAGVMVYEATGRHGQRLATVVGALLLWLAALILLPGWLPA